MACPDPVPSDCMVVTVTVVPVLDSCDSWVIMTVPVNLVALVSDITPLGVHRSCAPF